MLIWKPFHKPSTLFTLKTSSSVSKMQYYFWEYVSDAMQLVLQERIRLFVTRLVKHSWIVSSVLISAKRNSKCLLSSRLFLRLKVISFLVIQSLHGNYFSIDCRCIMDLSLTVTLVALCTFNTFQ